MARFILGDELGNIKTLRCFLDSNDSKTTVSTIHHREPSEGVNRGVQQIASSTGNENTAVVCPLYLKFNHGEP
jgi:ribosome biogenesis protein NSA1